MKNGFVWLPVFFGHKLTDTSALANAMWAFIAFSLAASSIYILNDLRDLDADREHPLKKNRPLAKEEIKLRHAVAFMAFLLVASLSVSYFRFPGEFILILSAYLIINIAYSFCLKRYAIVDVVCIAIGFVLRVFAGGVVTEVPISQWIIIMTFLLAIFLALGKRRDDLLLMTCGHNPRKCLSGYNIEFVSSSMIVMTSVVIVAYILYCVSPEIIQKHGTNNLYLTSFWVIVGILRYMQITFVEGRSGEPTLILLHDHFLWGIIGGWFLTFYWIMYGSNH